MGDLIECTPDNKIVIVDYEKYTKMKELSLLNKKNISDRAKEMYLDYIKTTGVKIEYKISNCKELLRHEVVVDIKNDTYYGGFSLSERVNYSIAMSLEKYIADFYKNYRKEAIEIMQSEWEKNNNRIKKRTSYLYIIIGALIVSNIISYII